jgi:hypothetical protein
MQKVKDASPTAPSLLLFIAMGGGACSHYCFPLFVPAVQQSQSKTANHWILYSHEDDAGAQSWNANYL